MYDVIGYNSGMQVIFRFIFPSQKSVRYIKRINESKRG